MKQPQPELTVRMPEDLLRRLLYLCEAEHRTPAAQFAFMLRNNISYYERVKGKMDASKLASYDLTPYIPVSAERGEEEK